MKKYREKPDTTEAFEFIENHEGLEEFFKADWVVSGNKGYIVKTATGVVLNLYIGDFIVKNKNGGYSVCKPDEFRARYEEV